MFRLLLKLAGGFLFVFILPIALIRAQNYDDSALRTFLTPPAGCLAPCFMGIRPGVTTFAQASTIVQTHEWVAQINKTQRFRNRYQYLFWQWNGSQAFLPVGSFDNRLAAGIEAAGDVSIQTSIAPVEIWWLYGAPHWVQRVTHDSNQEQYLFGYPDHKIIVSINVPRCTRLLNVLTRESKISFVSWVFDKPEHYPDDFLTDPEIVYFRNVNPCVRD